MVLGVPGIIYAIFFFITVKEPPRGYAENIAEDEVETPALIDVFKLLLSRKALIYLSLGCGLNAFVLYGIGNWLPSFLSRMHGMEQGEIGTWLGLGVGLGGAFGVWLGGFLGDRFGQQDQRWYLWIPAFTITISAPIVLIILFSSSKYIVLVNIALSKILWTTYLGPSIAMAHGLVGLRMRALASAVLFLVLNFIGLGLGPPFFGMLSDYLAPSLGVESLRWAMSVGVVVSLVAAFLFWRGSVFLRADLARSPCPMKR